MQVSLFMSRLLQEFINESFIILMITKAIIELRYILWLKFKSTETVISLQQIKRPLLFYNGNPDSPVGTRKVLVQNKMG